MTDIQHLTAEHRQAVQAFVERLEKTAEEEEEAADPTELPSGDVIAREFQRFLRQRGSGGPGSTAGG